MQRNAREYDSAYDAPLAPLPAADSLLWAALPRLQLNIAQTASLCGISVRQLGYWTKQGYVTATGRGSRRMYDLNALQRILAIKKVMTEGASLRQALRALPAPDAPMPPAQTGQPAEGDAGPRRSASAPSHVLTAEEAAAVTSDLLALFGANRHTRDSAAGLAVKTGHATDKVRAVVEGLCGRGLLYKTHTPGETVFERAGKDAR